MFPNFDDIPIFTNIKITTTRKKGGRGEWIHLVLLGMANRCQMGINGPPNVLLQKAFFSAQYFAYMAQQHIHHQLAKESLNDIQNFF